MRQAIETEIHGLKCDADGCGYLDDTVSVQDYDQHLNRPCPVCGASLLTEADLKAVKALLATADWINSLGLPTGGEVIEIDVEMNGSGIPVPRIREPKP